MKEFWIAIAGVVAGFILSILGRKIDSWLSELNSQKVFRNECRDLKKWSERTLRLYCSAWADMEDYLFTPHEVSQVSNPRSPPARLFAEDYGFYSLIKRDNDTYRAAVRSVIDTYSRCQDDFLHVQNIEGNFFHLSRERQIERANIYRKATVSVALLWSHSDNIVRKRYHRAILPDTWEGELQMAKDRVKEVGEMLKINLPEP